MFWRASCRLAACSTRAAIMPRMKLAHALIAKSIVETLLVGALAVGFYVNAFPPTYHGWGEMTPDSISGWAVNVASPTERVEVQLFIDNYFVASATANQSRPDIVTAGWARDEWHGFRFNPLPLSREYHVARVYVLHSSKDGKQQTLQLLGEPIYFSVDASGKLIAAGYI